MKRTHITQAFQLHWFKPLMAVTDQIKRWLEPLTPPITEPILVNADTGPPKNDLLLYKL